MAGMDKAEALAWLSRLFDAAAAGAVIWGDPLLVQRFLTQCSRTGSEETIRGYKREIKVFSSWRDQNHPHLHLREIDPGLAQDWVDELRQEVEAGQMAPRTFNRRVAAISSLYRWAAEPSRASVTGVVRNPMPPRSLMHAGKTARGLTQEDLAGLFALVRAHFHTDRFAKRDLVLTKGSCLLGCRVSEIARLKWADVEQLSDGCQIHLLGKGSKSRVVSVSSETLALFEALGRGSAEDWVFPSSRREGHLTRQAIGDVMRKWSKRAGFHLHPHQLRHSHATHAIRRGTSVLYFSRHWGMVHPLRPGITLLLTPATVVR